MDRIDPDLHVGSLADADDGAALRDTGIELVVRHTHESLDVREGVARVGAARDEADLHPTLVRRAAASGEREG